MSVYLWSIYKLPEWTRSMLGRPEPDYDRIHDRAARAVLACALDLRGVIIKVCQAVATRSTLVTRWRGAL